MSPSALPPRMASLDLPKPAGVLRMHRHFDRAFGLSEPSRASTTLDEFRAELARPASIRFVMAHGRFDEVGRITDGLPSAEYTAITDLHDGPLPCDILVALVCRQEPSAWLPLVADGTAVVTYSGLLYNSSIDPLVTEFSMFDPVENGEIEGVLDSAAAVRAAASKRDYFGRQNWRVAIKGA